MIKKGISRVTSRYGQKNDFVYTLPGPQFPKLWSQIPLVDITPRSESSFFYFIFDPAIVGDYFKTKLKDEELDEGGRCSHLKKFPAKFQIAECCITQLPIGLRHSDFPKREFFL